jgi:ATP-dependent Clp protease ATP-binding subunit ClpX
MRAGGVTNAAVASNLMETVGLFISSLTKCWVFFYLFWFVSKFEMRCLLLQVESSDLIAYGLIPEFVGRFPVLVSLSALTENQLMQVLGMT